MADGEWTAWKIWWHPRMALDALIDSEIMENEYIRRLMAAEGKMKDYDCLSEKVRDYDRLSEEVTLLKQRCTDSEKAHAETLQRLDESQRRLDDALGELAEYKDIDRQLEEFGRMLSGIEEMKRNYEGRIKDLKARLREALVKISSQSDIIDSQKPEKIRMSDTEPSDDWLMELPDDL